MVLAAVVMTASVGAAVDAPVADAARAGDRDAVKSLLKDGADVNAPQGDGMTALHWAAERGDLELTNILIYGGANVGAVTRIGQYTPLHIAARTGNAAVVKALVAAKADVAREGVAERRDRPAPGRGVRQRRHDHDAARQQGGRQRRRSTSGARRR